MNTKYEFERWLKKCSDDFLLNQLKSYSNDEIEDAFYRDLEFGTGGLRGVIGAGANRINIYTVSKASQGLANYLNNSFSHPSIAIAYDSRIKSDEFARVSAEVFAANGIKVHIYPELMPTPCLSFAVRYLKCSAGIVITASHNPSKYNGYKVYGSDGCQITNKAADAIQAHINKVDIFDDVKRIKFDDGVHNGMILFIQKDVYDSFYECVSKQSVLFGDEINKNIKIVYTPLNGSGLKPVTHILSDNKFDNVIVVPEQANPDGRFPTCSYPNPEVKEALSLGIKLAEKENADLVLATDPDCDRVGIAVKNNDSYVLLSGNEVGLLLLDYICSQRIKHNAMPRKPYVVKTIVTTDLAERIASNYGVHIKNVLTGFKYIGEQIGLDEDNYVFGFEESYGYLSGAYVRDKDAVDGSLLISEMFCFYKTRNISLVDKLADIYKKYGYCKNNLYTFTFEGKAGMEKMNSLMSYFRKGHLDNAIFKVENVKDYLNGIEGLPKSNVVKFYLDDGSTIVVRPSGTEPKLKVYLSIVGEDVKSASLKEKTTVDYFQRIINKEV